VKLFQTQAKLKYIPLGAQKIKIDVDKELGLLPRQGQKRMCLNYGL
jgi:hypothetical protein